MNAIEFATAMSTNVYTIEFEKVDGTIRKMVCTRMSEKIPAEAAPKKATVIEEATTAVPVFDVDLEQWRSVRPNSIKTMEIV